jgi:hypothetical protein
MACPHTVPASSTTADRAISKWAQVSLLSMRRHGGISNDLFFYMETLTLV